jgi:hypothetical protein
MIKKIIPALILVVLFGCNYRYVPREYYTGYKDTVINSMMMKPRIDGYYYVPYEGGKYFDYNFFYANGQCARIFLPRDDSKRILMDPDSLLKAWILDQRFIKGLSWGYFKSNSRSLYIVDVDYPFPGLFLLPYSLPIIKSEYTVKSDSLIYSGYSLRTKKLYNLVNFTMRKKDDSFLSLHFHKFSYKPDSTKSEFDLLHKNYQRTKKLRYTYEYRKKIVDLSTAK